jgi:transcriptional regulator with XRE-family HTH domain
MDSFVKIFISNIDTARNKWRRLGLLVDDQLLQMQSRDVGERIRQARETLRLTQGEFAGQLGVTRVSVARYEAGRVPNLGLLRKIAQLAGMTVAWLLGGVGDEESQCAANDRPSPLEVAEAHNRLVAFLKQDAAKAALLPKILRRSYDLRLHESIARLERELEEYRQLLEGGARTSDQRKKRLAKKRRPQ